MASHSSVVLNFPSSLQACTNFWPLWFPGSGFDWTLQRQDVIRIGVARKWKKSKEPFVMFDSLRSTCHMKDLRFFSKILILYWGIAGLQCCASLRWTAKRQSYMYMYPFSPQTPLPCRLPHNTEQSCMFYTIGAWWLANLNTVMCTWPSQTLCPLSATINMFF